MSGQPDNWNDEDCGELVGESFGQWNDENCNSKRKYICKYINGKETWMQALSGLFPFMSTGTNFIVLSIIQTIECKEM